MTINLSKGQKINLTKEAKNGLSKTIIGLGWDQIKKKGLFGGLQTADLDASILLSTETESMVETVYYGEKISNDRSIQHTGDNLTGEGEGDDEQIKVDFSKVSPEINRLTVVVNIYNAKAKKQNFGMIKNAYVHVLDQDNKEIVQYNLTNDNANATGIVVGEFVRKGNEWEFTAIGKGVVLADINGFKAYL
ncbi:hypothetical protein LL14B4_10510 [Lactococcus lactis subsp. lactis]|uniref:TerD domain-containing protein n=1 Tax=Lactococcus lactis subsp. lactis TaxID=1360 RepID=A0A2Z3KLY9_LACLL|nr:TerD family protein [Lactococcus lactis]AWN66584.1 hypothetical protein LL14B4_10510 [Lactococcus lactis subsp. lactis]